MKDYFKRCCANLKLDGFCSDSKRIKELEEENEALRKDALKMMIKEMHFDGKDFEILATTGVGYMLAELTKAMLTEQKAPNFVSYRLVFNDEDGEKFYVVAGRCDGLSIAEKYEQVYNENKDLKKQIETLHSELGGEVE